MVWSRSSSHYAMINTMGTETKKGTAVITGATSGIGRAYAVALGRRGFRLILTGRRRDKLDSLAAEIAGEVEIRTGDLRDPTTLADLVDRVTRCDDLKMVIHNAGFGHKAGFFSLSPEDLRGMGVVHMESAVELLRAAIPIMKPAAGRSDYQPAVILVSSLAAFFPAPGPAMYTATKGFLLGLGRALHPALARRRIKMQVLCPGFTHTEFHDRLEWSADQRRNRGVVRWMRADDVVGRSLRALRRRGWWRDPLFIPGTTNRLLLAIVRLLPWRVYARVAERM